MKHIDYLYFNIYNYFYRASQYRQTPNPRIQAMYLFSLGTGGWLLLLESLYLHVIKHTRFSSKGESAMFAFTVYILTTFLFHYIFIMRDRDQKIFGKYEAFSNRNPKRKWHLLVSAAILAIPYLALISMAVLSPRH